MLAVIEHHLLKISVNFLWDFLPVGLLLFLCFFHDSCGVKVQQSGQFKGSHQYAQSFPTQILLGMNMSKPRKITLELD